MRCLVVLIGLIATPVFADDWPQWLGARRDGGTSEKIAPWKEALKVLWRQPVGEAYSSPVVSNGRVFVHTRVKDKDEEEVVCYDAKDGKQLWRDSYPRAVYRSAVGTGPRATPTVSGKRLYTFGITGVLSCYAVEDGKRLWQVDAYKKLDANLPTFGVCCSPLVVGDLVIVSVGGKGKCVVAFDAASGEVRWQTLDDGASSSSPILFNGVKREGALPDVVFMTPLRLIGLDPLDGTMRWEFPIVFQPADTSPTPMILGDQIIASTISTGAVGIKFNLGDDEKVTTKELWRDKQLSAYFSSGVAVGKSRALLITNVLDPIPNATLRCVDPSSGKEIWKKSGIGYFHAGLIRMGDGRLLILDDSGTLKLVEGESSEYRELSKAKICRGTLINPAFANGHLYARDDRELVCVPLVP